jgi:predicted HicB family RNase H-like nuclease
MSEHRTRAHRFYRTKDDIVSDTTTKGRIMIYVPTDIDERIRRAAERAGQSLSVWLQRAAEAALREQEGK